MYSYGEESIIVPLNKKTAALPASMRIAERTIRKVIQEFVPDAKVKLKSDRNELIACKVEHTNIDKQSTRPSIRPLLLL